MKSLQESLFDKDLVKKKYDIDPLSIAWDWEFTGNFSYSRGVVNVPWFLYDNLFDQKYIKSHKPQKDIAQAQSHPGVEDKSTLDMITSMAYIIGMWPKDIVPNNKKIVDTITINNAKYFPGLIKSQIKNVELFLRRDKFYGEYDNTERLDITIQFADNEGIVRPMTFTYKLK